MGLTATVYTTDPRAHEALLEGDVDEFYSFLDPETDRVQRVDEDPLHLDKLWHAIHFLLTGDKSGKFLLGGCEVPEVSEPLESHSAASVADVVHKINGRSASEILDGCSWDELNEAGIYGGPWDESARPYLLENLSGFLDKITTAAAENRGLFVVLMT